VELAAERQRDLIARHLAQQLDDVLGIEPDRSRLGVVLGLELLADLAEIGVIARDGHPLQRPRQHAMAVVPGARVGRSSCACRGVDHRARIAREHADLNAVALH
jgi:hypothetical protein